MKALLNPKWLILTFLIPICILFASYYGVHKIIGSLLLEQNIHYWKIFGWSLTAISITHISYAIYCVKFKKKLSLHYGYASLIVYATFLYLYCYHYDDIIPFNIPQWMISENMTLYVGTFIMPTLLHSLFILIIRLTSANKDHSAALNFFMAIGIPAICYFFIMVLLPFWRKVGYNFQEHVLTISFVVATVLFLFFAIRGVYILLHSQKRGWKKYATSWKIVIAVIMPLLGLALNNGHLNDSLILDENVFGNFNSPWFYALAIINGIVICLPSLKHRNYRFLLFVARSMTFSFTFYFFVVFLPYLPLAIPAIIAFGLGFLMIAPSLLFVIHCYMLSEDLTFLKSHFSSKTLTTALILSLLVIPAGITISFSKDKRVLNNALNYLYAPDFKNQKRIDTHSLKKTLTAIKRSKRQNWTAGFSSQATPYISSYFSWYVLDNLTISSAKINKIERVFFDAQDDGASIWRSTFNDDIITDSISASSNFDTEQNAWTSWVDLELLHTSASRRAEYNIDIDLPPGCWISDYYLYVGDKKEMGILAEKKAAMWVYSNITAGQRDPGILHYQSGNKVTFRVFPFQANERRKTGIQFIHREPVSLNIDGYNVQLGNKDLQNQSTLSFEANDAIYISSADKKKLNKVKRQPYFHFVVDASQHADSLFEAYMANIKQFIASSNIVSDKNLMTFYNSYASTYHFNELTAKPKITSTGGFFVERAIQEILTDSYTTMDDSYPIIIVVADNMQNAIISKDFANYAAGYPESDKFYHLNLDGKLSTHSLNSNPKIAIPNAELELDHEVYQWSKGKQKIFLPIDEHGSIVIVNQDIKSSASETKQWTDGLMLHAKCQNQVFYPSTNNSEWLDIIKNSFRSKIMTPHTSYLVVENEAQKAALLKKQEQVLKGNKSLDAGDIDRRMSEPGLVLLCGIFGVFLVLRRRRIKIAR